MAGDASWDKVSLLLHCDGVNGATTLVDKSPTPKAPTFFGDAKISTAQSVFDGASLLLDGNGDYVSYADHADFELGALDFFAEARIRLTGYGLSYGGSAVSEILGKDAVGDRGFSWYVAGVGTTTAWSSMYFDAYNAAGALTRANISFTFALNTWYSVAVGRSGNLIYFFVDGVLKNPGGTAFNLTIKDTATTIKVGAAMYDASNQYYFTGHLEELRLTKGVCRATATYSVATAAFPDGMGQVSGTVKDASNTAAARVVRAYRRDIGALIADVYTQAADANINSVVLLLHGDGATGSTTIADSSKYERVITPSGNAQISRAQSVYGGASIAFDGSGDYIRTAAQLADFNFSAGDFTIEFLAWFNSLTGDPYLVEFYGGATSQRFALQVTSSGTLQLYVESGAAGGTYVATGVTIATGAWYHIALVKTGTTTKIFVSGFERYSGTPSQAYTNNNCFVEFGAAVFAGSNYFNGYLDEFRITKGVARYVANFTPPTDRFPDRFCSGAVGEYSFYTPTLDELNVICLDDAAGTVENDLVLRAIPA